jgi:hypothetical protein
MQMLGFNHLFSRSKAQGDIWSMARNVFIGFEMEDHWARNLLATQARDQRFDLEFYDYSVKDPFERAWKTNCKARIALTSATLCLIGQTTWRSEAVDWEIRASLDMGHKVIGVRIHRDRSDPIPVALNNFLTPILPWDMSQIDSALV